MDSIGFCGRAYSLAIASICYKRLRISHLHSYRRNPRQLSSKKVSYNILSTTRMSPSLIVTIVFVLRQPYSALSVSYFCLISCITMLSLLRCACERWTFWLFCTSPMLFYTYDCTHTHWKQTTLTVYSYCMYVHWDKRNKEARRSRMKLLIFMALWIRAYTCTGEMHVFTWSL